MPTSRAGRQAHFFHLAALAAACLALLGLAPTAAHAEPSRPPAAPGPATPGDGPIVAHLEIELPRAQLFTLRATLPVPPGTWDEGQPVPLTVLAADGTPRPTQLERVSRYPNPEDGADVVEVWSRVTRPPGKEPGDRHVYEVALQTPPGTTAELTEDVLALLAGDTQLRLQANDVFGNPYRIDLTDALRQGGLPTPRRGPVAYQRVAHEVLRPDPFVVGTTGTLPHLMGVHAYLTTFADEDFVLLDLHVHNGLNGLLPEDRDDDVLNRVLFDRLLLRVPEEWRVVFDLEDPRVGVAFEGPGPWRTRAILRPEGGDQLHAMHRQARFVRRLAIAKPGVPAARAAEALREHWLAFCRPGTVDGQPLWSWWNPATARYFPQNHALPTLDHVGLAGIRAGLAAKLDDVRERTELGQPGAYPFLSGRLGWAHPWGVAYGGMAGGDEIHQLDGVRTAGAASRDGYRLHQLIARAYASRQPTALYHLDGRPTRMEHLLVTEGFGAPYVDGFFHDQRPGPNQDPIGFGDGPSFQWNAALAEGRVPGYLAELETWGQIDRQHLIRWTRTWKVLAWLGNDALAKDLLTATGELFRLEYHPFPVEPYGYFQPTGLLDEQLWVAQKPHKGLDFRRGEAWGVDAAVCAYRFARDPARVRWRVWFGHLADLLEDGQSACTGNLMSAIANNLWGGQYRIRQSREEAFVQQAIRSMATSVWRGFDPERFQTLADVAVASHYGSVAPPFWPDGAEGAWAAQAVGFANPAQSSDWCLGGLPGTHQPQVADVRLSNSLAYAFAWTQDPLFLEKAALVGPTNQLFADQDAWGLYQLENRAALLALLQRFDPED